jgi:hypothetical protein
MNGMTTFETYRCYCAMKAHFTTDRYDIFTRKGIVAASLESLKTRKDRFRLETLSRKLNDKEIVNFFLANFVQKPDYAGLWDEQSDKRYINWLKHTQSLKYEFNNEIKSLFQEAKENCQTYEDLFVSLDNQHPPIIIAYMGKRISIETLIIIDRINNFTDKMVNDIVIKDVLRLAKKYSPFLKVDIDAYRIITDNLRESVFEC